MKQKVFVAMILLIVGLCSASAMPGFIKGKIIDKKTGEELVGTAVVIEGTTIGAITDFNGNFVLPALDEGSYTVRIQYISYNTMVFEDVVVKPGEDTFLNIELSQVTMSIDEVAVVGRANRESEKILLMEQKNAILGKQFVGAQQLNNQGVSDAAEALSKVTGISKQEGTSSLNVRGLGDRYNSTTYNGLSLPSNNAELKNMDLGLFSTGIIEYIGIEKNFDPSMYGDVAGANVDVVSKKHSGNPYLTLGGNTGINTNVAGLNEMRSQHGPGFWGFDNFTKPARNSFDGRFMKNYDFKNSLNPISSNINPNVGFGLSGGRSLNMNNGKLNAFATINYDNEYNYSHKVERNVNGSGDVRMDMEGPQYLYKTQATGMLNLNYTKGKTNLFFNSLVMNSSDEELKELSGYKIDVVPTANYNGLLRRSQMLRNVVLVNQIIAKHALSQSVELDIRAAYNTVKNIIPDRRFNIFITNPSGIITPGDNDAADNHRFFHELDENEWTGLASISKTMGSPMQDTDYRGKISLGVSAKWKKRNFEAEQYNHDIIYDSNGQVPTLGSVSNIDDYFNDATLGEIFKVTHLTQSYKADQKIWAGFIAVDYYFSNRLSGVFGARLEHVRQDIAFRTTINPDGNNGFDETNVFPSFSLRYKLNEASNLRFASSISYTLPQFIETAPFLFENSNEDKVGNPYIEPSTNYNAEVKWELFPDLGEVVAITGFGKYLANPINKFVLSSAGNEFSYANTGDWAYAVGVELEAQKDLINISTEEGDKKIIISGNLSLMKTKQQLNSQKINEQSNGQYNANFNTDREQLQGSAPLIANASLRYEHSWDQRKKTISSALVYGYTSDRINTIGFSSIGNQIDKAVNNLDFVVRSKWNNLGLNASAKNILNPAIKRTQEGTDVVVNYLKRGVKVSIGISYTF